MNRERALKLKRLQENVAYTFKDLSLLNLAFTHTSYVNENPDQKCRDNERFEFLGDAVLTTVISHLLMDTYPFSTEGDLTKLRSAIVNDKSIAQLARHLQLGDFLLLGKGEESTKGRHKSSILANTYEALIAAIFLDGGYKKAVKIIAKHFHGIISALHQGTVSHSDYKSQLQEYTQAVFKTAPHYTLMSEYGPDHDKSFEITITINGKVWGKGIGKSKKEAAQNAAQVALEKLLQK